MPMIKTFTQTDAIRYVYGELTANENHLFERAMLVDATLRNEVKELRKLKNDLNKVEMKPSQKAIDNILSYSKSLDLHP